MVLHRGAPDDAGRRSARRTTDREIGRVLMGAGDSRHLAVTGVWVARGLRTLALLAHTGGLVAVCIVFVSVLLGGRRVTLLRLSVARPRWSPAPRVTS